MPIEVANTDIRLSFEQLAGLSAIERFTGSWSAFEKTESQSRLKQLRADSSIQSVISALALEEKYVTEEEVKSHVFQLAAKKDSPSPDLQVAMGYYEVLENIKSSYRDFAINEQTLQFLHRQLYKYCPDAIQQKGRYKSARTTYELRGLSVEIDGFETPPAPGIETEYGMRALFENYQDEPMLHPLLRTAEFLREFLRIHPFQSGNVMISHLLSTLTHLKDGYTWILYTSFEQELEHKKEEYLSALSHCYKSKQPEHSEEWLNFYLQHLKALQTNLDKTREQNSGENQLAPRDKKIYSFIERNPGCKSGQIAARLAIPLPTMKKILANMTSAGLLSKLGVGAGTNYTTQKLRSVKTDIAVQLDEKNFLKTFILEDKYAFVCIKKIILTPRFDWQRAEDWQRVLVQQNLELKVKCITGKGKVKKQSYKLASFVTDYHFNPVFTLSNSIHLPQSLWEKAPFDNEFRIKASIELFTPEEELKFDVAVVYDAGME